MSTHPIEIVREFASPAQRVFAAWLDPAQVSAWMTPSVTASAEIDARVGGHYSVFHRSDGEDVGGFEAIITDLEEPTRIGWDWGFVGPGDRVQRIDSRLDVTIEPLGEDRSRLSLRHSGLDDLQHVLPAVAAQLAGGWAEVLDLLAARLTATPD